MDITVGWNVLPLHYKFHDNNTCCPLEKESTTCQQIKLNSLHQYLSCPCNSHSQVQKVVHRIREGYSVIIYFVWEGDIPKVILLRHRHFLHNLFIFKFILAILTSIIIPHSLLVLSCHKKLVVIVTVVISVYGVYMSV